MVGIRNSVDLLTNIKTYGFPNEFRGKTESVSPFPTYLFTNENTGTQLHFSRDDELE